ncbi:putative pentatricopeptide repeat-containing protein At3g01580 [Macadamia integrifolia]|uniref:putative pentatricopeptide repeat-containing protein At3g01580 n=1 Tax=Macadamia integrifolia TaxID=60698 RepID=UPI001C4FC134|nr:putative pentatricopeptide repeat-containing protein At3g01580 [Macadamia integrifolia]
MLITIYGFGISHSGGFSLPFCDDSFNSGSIPKKRSSLSWAPSELRSARNRELIESKANKASKNYDIKCKESRVEKISEFGLKPISKQSITELKYTHALQKLLELQRLDEAKDLCLKMKRKGFEPPIVLQSMLIDLFMKSACISDAYEVFGEMPERNVVTWTSMISGCVRNGYPEVGISLFWEMIKVGVLPNDVTFNVILQACADLSTLNFGIQIHSLIVRAGFFSDYRIENCLIYFYSKCGLVDLAHQVFIRMLKPDLVSFTSMIGGYLKNGLLEPAFGLFDTMRKLGLDPNEHTISSILVACQPMVGEQIHAYMVKTLLDRSLYSASALIEFYSKNNSFESAMLVFEKLGTMSVVTWSSMISCCARNGLGYDALELFYRMVNLGIKPNKYTFVAVIGACGLSSMFMGMGKQVHCFVIKLNLGLDNRILNALVTMYARNSKIEELGKVFEKIQDPDTVSWSAAIIGYSQNALSGKSTSLFCQMHKSGAKPNEYGFSGVLSSCSTQALLDQGKQVHGFALKLGCDTDVCVGNSLVNMYAKCGNIDNARLTFDGMPRRDLMSWNTLIHGYAHHGHGKKAFQLFDEMVESGSIKPNNATFVGILNACSHAGYVEEGFEYFKIMESCYGIVPSISHYACLVDMMGRVGRLDDAVLIIEHMPFQPDYLIWKTLLGSCRVHMNLKLGKCAAQRAIELSPEDSANYVLLSNLLAECGERLDSERTRKMMEERGVKKDAGWSWIEIKSVVNAFIARDRNHPEAEAIYHILDELLVKMKEEGYSPDFSWALYDS